MAEPDIYDQSKLGVFCFFPGELRKIIYRMLLSNRYAHEQGTPRFVPLHRSSRRPKLAPLHPNILQCNHQIYDEAINILHGENIWIIAKIDIRFWPLVQEATQLRSRNNADSVVKFPALMIDFSIPVPVEEPPCHVVVIFDEGRIDDFILGLWRISSDVPQRQNFEESSLILRLCKTDFHTVSKLKSICLKPFDLVYGLQNFSVQSHTDLANLMEVFNRAESRPELATHLQAVFQGYDAQGGKAYFAGDIHLSLHRYQYVVHYISHRLMLVLNEYLRPMTTAARRAILWGNKALLQQYENTINRYASRTALAIELYQAVQIRGLGSIRVPFSELSKMRRMLCMARAHCQFGEVDVGLRLLYIALVSRGDKRVFLDVLLEMCPWVTWNQYSMLYDEEQRLRTEGSIDFNAIRIFWDTLCI